MYDNMAAHPPYPLPAGPPPYLPPPPHNPSPVTGDDRRWLPIISLVMSVVALVAVASLAAWILGSGASTLFGDGAAPTLSGQVRDTPAGVLPGTSLTTAVTEVIEHDVGHVTAMTCPDTPAVNQGVVTVCHGSIDGESWAVVVFFENRQGSFTLQLL